VVLRPFVSAALWAAVLCYCTWPAFTWLETRVRRRWVAAGFMTAVIALVMVAPFAIVGITLAENVERLEGFARQLASGVPAAPPAWLVNLPLVGPAAARYWAEWAQDTERVSGLMSGGMLQAGKWALRNGMELGRGVFQLCVSVLLVYLFFRDGERIAARIQAGSRRIAGESTQRLLNLVGRTVKGVVYGIIGTGVAQGLVAALGFSIAGVPSPVFLGVLTFVLSFIPIGPPMVWIPVAAWVFYRDGLGWALFMGIWGVLGISGIDNLVRPILISRFSNVPFIITFLGVVGGVLAFGFIGIFLGPTLLAVGHSLVREFAPVKPGGASPASPPPAPGC
jgi:predicted PurR-regulated permease PerM